MKGKVMSPESVRQLHMSESATHGTMSYALGGSADPEGCDSVNNA